MGYFHYFVEGETDEKMVSILKTELQYIQSGKIDVINVITKEISKSRVMKLKRDTTVILVFDTDRAETEILNKNIKFLKRHYIFHYLYSTVQKFRG